MIVTDDTTPPRSPERLTLRRGGRGYVAPFIFLRGWYHAIALAIANPAVIRAGWRLGVRFGPDAITIIHTARDLAGTEEDGIAGVLRLIVIADQIADTHPMLTASEIVRLLQCNAKMKRTLGVIDLGT